MHTTLIYPPGCLTHDTGAHDERPERLEAIRGAIVRRWPDAAFTDSAPATVEALARCHEPAYIAVVERVAARGGGYWDLDTPESPGSYTAACLAAGAAIAAADTALAGQPAFALVRPPGHHALPDHAMGFCFFNNVVVAARHAQAAGGVERVLIVDWDVHHGNGTQALVYRDGSIGYFSLHQYPFYPGTGAITEMGAGDGYGTVCNVPLPAGCGDADYLAVFRRVLMPFARRFRPDLILVSAGYDAHRRDPLGGMRLSADGIAALTAVVLDLAATLCGGRLALVLEGGYDLNGLAESVVSTVVTLDGAPAPAIPAGVAAPVQRVLDHVRAQHDLP